MTTRQIADRVAPGELIGAIGDTRIVAPIAGVLRGLTARGAKVSGDDLVVEIDPRCDTTGCFGFDTGALAIARAVSAALAVRSIDRDRPVAAAAAT